MGLSCYNFAAEKDTFQFCDFVTIANIFTKQQDISNQFSDISGFCRVFVIIFRLFLT